MMKRTHWQHMHVNIVWCPADNWPFRPHSDLREGFCWCCHMSAFKWRRQLAKARLRRRQYKQRLKEFLIWNDSVNGKTR